MTGLDGYLGSILLRTLRGSCSDYHDGTLFLVPRPNLRYYQVKSNKYWPKRIVRKVGSLNRNAYICHFFHLFLQLTLARGSWEKYRKIDSGAPIFPTFSTNDGYINGMANAFIYKKTNREKKMLTSRYIIFSYIVAVNHSPAQADKKIGHFIIGRPFSRRFLETMACMNRAADEVLGKKSQKRKTHVLLSSYARHSNTVAVNLSPPLATKTQ